eukprot:scaffold82481_cov63-Phaeocystis_antarctica.AAC.2
MVHTRSAHPAHAPNPQPPTPSCRCRASASRWAHCRRTWRRGAPRAARAAPRRRRRAWRWPSHIRPLCGPPSRAPCRSGLG